ncbi:MAG: acyl CoA:acetate/3-ketoacid CoA transferase [Deltaproteobacteria bacterium]|nr:acyl CoA:acetate/3-ketoacid CoA transferase [Deltaproteobacteria bacterium]
MSEARIVHPFESDRASGMKRGKVVAMEDAVRVVRDGDTVGFAGIIGTGFAEGVARALEQRFLETKAPRDLTVICAAGIGDAKEKGINHLGHEGLVRRAIAGHWGMMPKLGRLAVENRIEAYNLPQGVLTQMFRDTAARKPRTLSRVGLGTFVDPRQGGGKVNSRTTEELVEVVTFDGEEFLAFRTLPLDVAVLRGTTADLDGNVTMEHEALTLDVLAMAMAAKNNGGLVIVQVERLADRGTLDARQVKLPGILVDCVVVADPEDHWQTFAERFNPAYCGEVRVPVSSLAPLPLDERKVIARRAAFELRPNCVVNLGIGVPEGVAAVAAEEGVLPLLTLTAEPGIIGGIPAGGLSFGAATNLEALLDMPYQFDFYDGGGLDVAFLGMAEADREGNLNVSRFGPRIAGCGGFINISQNAKRVVFLGTFTAGGLEVAIEDGRLRIAREGKVRKFVEQVEQITFSGRVAAAAGRSVLYVTERCVFRLGAGGLELLEVAPGIDVERDVLAKMAFAPVVPGTPRPMDPRIFGAGPMGLRDDLLTVPLATRFSYHAAENVLFINFEGLAVNDRKTIEDIRAAVGRVCEPLGRRVHTIVNYDNFSVAPGLVDEYWAMVREVVDRHYDRVTRYTTSAFLRAKLGDALKQRGQAPHIYENRDEARTALEQRS